MVLDTRLDFIVAAKKLHEQYLEVSMITIKEHHEDMGSLVTKVDITLILILPFLNTRGYYKHSALYFMYGGGGEMTTSGDCTEMNRWGLYVHMTKTINTRTRGQPWSPVGHHVQHKFAESLKVLQLVTVIHS